MTCLPRHMTSWLPVADLNGNILGSNMCPLSLIVIAYIVAKLRRGEYAWSPLSEKTTTTKKRKKKKKKKKKPGLNRVNTHVCYAIEKEVFFFHWSDTQKCKKKNEQFFEKLFIKNHCLRRMIRVGMEYKKRNPSSKILLKILQRESIRLD